MTNQNNTSIAKHNYSSSLRGGFQLKITMITVFRSKIFRYSIYLSNLITNHSPIRFNTL